MSNPPALAQTSLLVLRLPFLHPAVVSVPVPALMPASLKDMLLNVHWCCQDRNFVNVFH
jgi:hypothetical protein